MTARAIIIAGLLAVATTTGSAQALTPMAPCDGPEGGMMVDSADFFGYDGSGFIIESYTSPTTEDGIIGGGKGPVPQLDNFHGFRVTDCRSGKIVAVYGASQFNDGQTMLATEFLRTRMQQQEPVKFTHVERAAKAVFGHDDYIRVVILRETEETCACGEYYPGLWKK